MSPGQRIPNVPVDPLFIDRWSPRAFASDPVPAADLGAMFEAARWAPSAMNEQPWSFVYASEAEALRLFVGLLDEGNQVWAKSAPVLAFLFARRRSRRSGDVNRWAEFDAGAAWLSLALQARQLGYYTHAMAGFDDERVYGALGVAAGDWRAMAAIAIGRLGDASALPEPLRRRERPSERAPLAEMVRPFGASPRCFP